MMNFLLQKLRNIYKFLSPRYQTVHLDYHVAVQPRGKNAALAAIIEDRRALYRSILKNALLHLEVFEAITKQRPDHILENEPQWNNGFLPGLDIVNLYNILVRNKPQHYIEIGSGNSTKVARKAIKDHNLPTKIISIDPFPRASIDHMADEVLRQPFEKLPDLNWIVEKLGPGDILFIDNSHRVFANSDAMVCLLELVPRLKPGVLVQIHDIYLPYDYPQFMCDRFYNEQYLLATLVLANPQRFQPYMPNFFVSEDPELSQILAPLWNHPNLRDVERHGGSFWMEMG